MRSSKSRSRSKTNRPRPLGNIVNRVFDSSGPEGKVRGTPQQIIDKYLVLARDAQLSNDRVAAENFLQHAEHYTRMLGEAMRESARENEQRRDGGHDGRQNRQRQGGDEGPSDQGRHDAPRSEQARADDTRVPQDEPDSGGVDRDAAAPRSGRETAGPRGGDMHHGAGDEARGGPAVAVIDTGAESTPAELVETPEAASEAPAPQRSSRRRGAADSPRQDPPEDIAAPADAPEAEAKPAPKRRAPRRPRKPAGDAEQPAEARSSAAE